MRKKNLFLAIAFTTFSSFSWGQLNIIEPGDSHVLNDSTIIVYGDATASEINVDLYLVNNELEPVNVFARRDSILLPTADTDNDFCWAGYCYPQSTNTSPYSENIGSHDTANSVNTFNGHYIPYGHMGEARIKYTFYTTSNPFDTSWIIVQYNATPTGIENIPGQSISISSPYPNPANNFVNFNYSLTNGIQSANLKVYNMLGECIQTLPLNTSKGKAILNTQNMSSGIYICEVQASGCQPVYQKLIVSH